MSRSQKKNSKLSPKIVEGKNKEQKSMTDTKCKMETINKAKSSYFEMIKVDKPLARMVSKKTDYQYQKIFKKG